MIKETIVKNEGTKKYKLFELQKVGLYILRYRKNLRQKDNWRN